MLIRKLFIYVFSGINIILFDGYGLLIIIIIITMVSRRKQLTKKEKEKIIVRYNRKETIEKIAIKYDRNKRTIQRIINRYTVTSSVARKTNLNKYDRENIINLVNDNPSITAIQIRDSVPDVSLNTIYRYLRKKGFDCGEFKKEPYRIVRPNK